MNETLQRAYERFLGTDRRYAPADIGQSAVQPDPDATANLGNYAGLTRSQQVPFSSRFPTSNIHITTQQIEASRLQQGAFVRAAQQEYQQIARDVQRRMEYDWIKLYNDQWMSRTWDPDMEMDIGL